jgi:hypothetical protein
MIRRNQITILVIAVALAGVLTAPFSYAQAQTATANDADPNDIQLVPDQPVSLSAQDLATAQTSESACQAFAKNVKAFGQQVGVNITANWHPQQDIPATIGAGAHIPAGCTISAIKGGTSNDVHIADRLNQAIKSRFDGSSVSSDGFLTATVDAQQTSFYQRLINFVFISIYGVIASLLGALANLAAILLKEIISFSTNAATPVIVGEGWLIIRDFMNLFFIFGLIVIGLGTILRIEAYNYKKLLVTLILMALLVNFSQVIAKTIISFFDMLINVIGGGSTDLFNYPAFLSSITNAGGWSDGAFGGSTQGVAVQSWTTMITGLIAVVAFVVLTFMFLIRLVGLWFLIMVSPAAYALNVLPQTKGLAQRWWNTFFKYLIWGPVALLFIRLGNRLIEIHATIPIIRDTNENAAYILIGAFLWAAVLMTKQSGMVGSAAIMGVANKTIGKAKGWNRSAHKAAGSYLARGTAAKHLGSGLGLIVGGQNTKPGRAITKAGESAGKRIGTVTARMQAAPQAVREYFKIADRARTKQINNEKLMTLAKAGTLDKSVYSELGPKHIKAMVDRGIKESEVNDILEYKGRVGADTLMLAFKNNGYLDKYSAGTASKGSRIW